MFPRSSDYASPSHEESWKPFLIDVDGGGGGCAPVPGLSGGRGGRGPLLGVSIPLLDGNCGVAGRARDVLPFLLIGGGGGRGPVAKEKMTFSAVTSILHYYYDHPQGAITEHAPAGYMLFYQRTQKWRRPPRRFSQERSRRIQTQKGTYVYVAAK